MNNILLNKKVGPNPKDSDFDYELKNLETDRPVRLDGKYTKYLTICLVVATLGAGFQVGWSTAIFNTPSETIRAFYVFVIIKNGGTLTTNTLDTLWAVTNGLMPAGGMVGGLISGYFADKIGSVVLNVISKFIETYITIMVSRFLAGVYSGFFTGILPLYLNECSSKNLRGLSGTMNQLAIVLGVVLVNIIGLPDVLGSYDLWPVLVGLTIVPAFFHIGLFFLSESPKHVYINKKDPAQAKQILMKLRDNDEELVDNELNELEIENTSQTEKASWTDLITTTHIRRALVVTIGIQMSQQLTGINAVTFYSTDIFKSAGLSGDWPVYATIILSVVNFLMTIVCMFLVDRTGRKILLLIGMIGLAVFSFLLAICRILATPDLEWLNYMTIVCAVFYIVFFAIGPGAIPWLITSELFESSARGKATSIAVFVNWMSNFLVTVTFPFIEGAIDNYSFFIYGGFAVLFAIFTVLFVPETKNKPIEQIVDMFKKKLIFLF